MKAKILLIASFFIFITRVIYSQYYNTGQDPAGLKWLQVKTERFNVIYPENYGQEGIDFAKALDKAYNDLSVLFHRRDFRIPVIIHNHTTRSNGYVSWAPKRMEIYPTPEENTIPLDIKRQLALHELTHVMQVESLNSGFSKVMTVFLGQQFTGIVTGLLPLWYLEGHAVFAETLFSESGRGRSPSFQNELRAIAVEKGKLYKYDKLLNGSFRDYTPDHYQFGYQMVTWSLHRNDPQLWNRVLNYTANLPFTLNPVNLSLRKDAGLTKHKLYNETFDSLKILWEKDIEESRPVIYEPVNPDKKGKFINYHSPVFAGYDSVIAIKTSLSDPPCFVLIRPTENREKRIHVPGYMYPYIISFAKGKMVWVENQSDIRWENRNYSVIKIKNLNTGETAQLTYGSRYLSASISPDGRIIAASENTADNKNNLVLLNSRDGYVIQSTPAYRNASLQRPQWSADGTKITVIYLTEEGEGILSLDPVRQEWKVLATASNDDLQSSFLRNDSLFFISSLSGTDNIYVLPEGEEIKSVTRSRFGVSDISLNGSSVMFSDYTSAGKDICISSVINTYQAHAEKTVPAASLIEKIDIKPEPEPEVPDITYSPTPYRKWLHLLGFHSWMPFYADVEQIQSDPLSVRPGAVIMSQNQLSTLTTTIGYEYSAENRHVFHSRIKWEGWLPVFESWLNYGQWPNTIGDSIPLTVNPGMIFSNRISLPLSFTPGRFRQTLNLSVKSDYENQYVYSKRAGIYDYGQNNITGRLYFSNFYNYAYRDIYPRWGQVIDLSYTSAPADKSVYGTDLAFRSSFYFPGLLKNNSLKINYEIEKLDFAALATTNRNRLPRGYENIISKDLRLVSINYYAPLAYPDFNIGPVFYLTRIRTGLFYDRAKATGTYNYIMEDGRSKLVERNKGTEILSSFGAELVSDFHLFRIPFPVTGGVQAVWKSFAEAPSLEFVFNIDIYGMTIGRSKL